VNEKAEPPKTTAPPATSTFADSPSGLDLNPRPPRPVRVSKRAGGFLLLLCAGVLGLFAYGGFKRQQRQVAALGEIGVHRNAAPATAAGDEIARAVPTGNLPTAAARQTEPVPELQPPDEPGRPSNSADRVVVRRAQPSAATAPPPIQPSPEPTPEERRLAQAYRREQEAIAAPTSIRGAFASALGSNASANAASPVAPDSASDLGALLRSLASGNGSTGDLPGRRNESEAQSFESQNVQAAKSAFLAKARSAAAADYLKSVRTAALSRYEIKAGWEIPAVLEQALNSDLPGELKALVTSNVYDTATGRFLLIPQGSRLVGVYDSRVGYGQDGAQVIWNRVIFPDASSLDLGGMIGQDAHGFSGFREKVDHHYRRLIGFAVLTSLFSAASEVAQSRNRTLLTYPSPGEVAASAGGQEMSDVGAQITRRNLNVQPTIKIPIGYKFNVRVNRDIVFDGPYQPLRSGAH